ncbi:MAG TPA: ester cyclase [Actinomycetes bacterium]|nr:ester cyclase [Actinomycetes bacterium]
MTAPAAELRRATDLIDAFNQADWDRLRGLLAPAVLYTETGTGRRVEGADAYLQLCQGWKDAFPDVEGTVTNTAAGDDFAVLEIRWDATHTGPLETPAGTVPASGNRISVDASFWVRHEGETIQEIHHHLDVLSLLQQVGALSG